MQHLVLYTSIVKFMSLHVPAGAYIPVASASPIYVPPVQRVLKHCGAHKHNNNIILTHTHVIQNNLAALPTGAEAHVQRSAVGSLLAIGPLQVHPFLISFMMLSIMIWRCAWSVHALLLLVSLHAASFCHLVTNWCIPLGI